MKCENCNKQHENAYGSGRFCTEKCARAFSTKKDRDGINKKRSKALSKDNDIILICKQCASEFSIMWSKRDQLFCSRSCSTIWKNENLNIAVLGGLSAAKINNRRSKNEEFFANLCKEEYGNILTNEAMFNNWDADVIIPKYKIAILWNGKWHYEKLSKKHSLEQVQNRDKIKKKEIKKCGYISYIIKDMGGYDPAFVEKQFLKLKKYIKTISS